MDALRTPAPRSRCAAVAALASSAFGALTGWLLPVATEGPGRSLDEALTWACAGVALAAAAWLWLGVLRLVLAAHGGRGGHAPTTGLPPAVRRIVLAACGVALSGTLAVSAAHATPDRSGGAAGLPLPERAATLAPASQVVVQPGDSLWAIAERTLPAGATDADVGHRWRQIHAANRDLVGPDPDHILPAQRLTLPAR